MRRRRPLGLVFGQAILPFLVAAFALTFVGFELAGAAGWWVGAVLACVVLELLGRRLNRIDPPEKYL